MGLLLYEHHKHPIQFAHSAKSDQAYQYILQTSAFCEHGDNKGPYRLIWAIVSCRCDKGPFSMLRHMWFYRCHINLDIHVVHCRIYPKYWNTLTSYHTCPKVWTGILPMSRSLKLLVESLNPVSIIYKSTAGRYRPVRVADGPITARYRFIKNASWETTGWMVKSVEPDQVPCSVAFDLALYCLLRPVCPKYLE